MIVTVYVDETGMDGPRVLLAGYVARLSGWHGFAGRWKALLKKEGIPYAHVLEMRKSDPPFENWGDEKTSAFIRKASQLISKHLDFGLTAAVNVKAHREIYLANLPAKAAPDSAYGLCARMFFEKVPQYVEKYFGIRHSRVNFVFARHDHRYAGAERIFDELKHVDRDFARKLGSIISGETHEYAGLQAADILAFMARRFEGTTTFYEVPSESKRLKSGETVGGASCPVFHVDITDDRLPAFHDVAAEIGRRRRHRRRERVRAARGSLSE